MYLKVNESIITPNNDGTYKVEFPNIDFTDVDGNIIKGTITVPKAISKDGEIIPLCDPIDLKAVGDTMFTIEVTE